MSSVIEKKIEELREQIRLHDYNYYILANPQITDQEFDKLYKELENLFREGKIHPMDLKNVVSHYINEMVNPVREAFHKDAKLNHLLETIRKFEVTR